MKIVAISDVHADAVTSGVQRFDEVQRHMLAAMGAAIREKADLFCFLGDLCDPDSGPVVFRCVELAIFIASQLEKNGIRSVWLAGNHDVIEDGRGSTTIDPLHGIVGGLVSVATEPRAYQLEGLRVTCLPYLSARREASKKTIAQEVEAMRGFAGPQLVLAHLTPRGIIPGEEAAEMARGREIYLPDAELLAARDGRPMLVLCGHIHKRQRHVAPSGLPVEIVGSAALFTHGEEHHRPGYLVVEI